MKDTYIPDRIVDEVARRIVSMGPHEVRTLLRRSGPFQPELTGFVVGAMYDGSSALRARATSGMVVAYEAFRSGYVKTRKARERLVRKWADEGERVASRMADEFTDIRSALADGIASSEPAVMDAVLDLAFGDDDRPDTALDGDEAWRLLAVVYTVVETLHECAGAPRFAPEPAETGAEGGASAGGPLHIALAWYTPEQWQRLRETADDVDALDDTYDAWLAGAREAEAELAADGLRTERVMIDVDHLLRWCADTGRRVTAASRAAYASWLQRTRRQGDQDGRADLQPPANK